MMEIKCPNDVCPNCKNIGILMKSDGTEYFCPRCKRYFPPTKLQSNTLLKESEYI